MHYRWATILISPAILFACAGQSTTPPPSPPPVVVIAPLEVSPPVAEQAPPAEAPPEEEEDRIPEGSDLKNAISKWVAENPGAEFDEVARMANRFLRIHGYPLVLDAAALVKNDGSALRVKSGKKVFLFEPGRELSDQPDVCGERYLRVPARILSADSAALVVQEKEFPFSLKGFKRDRFRVFKGKKLVAVLHAPEPTEPIGLSANGKALFTKFLLNDGEVGAWWQKVGVSQPSVLDEDAYLMLRVEKSRLYFDENIEHLPAQEFEVEGATGANIRWQFQPSNLILELSSHCG